MKVPSGGPAFPFVTDDAYCIGMTLRDYFAAKAMHGILSDPDLPINAKTNYAWVADSAYRLANQMLKTRKYYKGEYV